MAWPLSLFTGASDASDSSASDSSSVDLHQSDDAVSPVAELLRYFEAPFVPPPPSSRVGDPKLKQRQIEPIRLWHLWKYGAFAAVKASEVLRAVVSHSIRGPPKKSWGIEMTFMTTIMRDMSRHSHLADVAMIRMLIGISGLVPVPSDALVTPVTFRVPKRALRGILAEFDALEDDTRELSGEWVVGKRTWQRLQREWQHSKRLKEKLGYDTTAAEAVHPSKRKERVILYLHGGAYYVSTPQTHRLVTIPLSKHLDARLFAVDYRLAPETRFPGPLHDAVSAYFRLIDDLHICPQNIIVAGDSAGGGLALALMMYLRDNDYPLPGGAILMSPWVDLTMSCDSWESNAKYDIVPMPQPGDHLNPVACYLGEHMEKYLTHPYASPLFGDLKGLPPLLIQGGDSEVLRDEVTLLAHKATLAGVKVRHELYEDMIHVFQAFPHLDQARQAFMSAREFTREVLMAREDAAPGLQPAAEESLEHEIDTSHTRVVNGDGTESTTNKDEMRSRKRFSVNVETVEVDVDEKSKDSDTEGTSSSNEEDPSWIASRPWPSPPTTPEMQSVSPRSEKRKELTRQGSSHSLPVSRRRAVSSAGTSWNPFASLTLPPHSPSHTHAPPLSTNSLRRVQSRPHLAGKGDIALSHPPPREYRLPATSLTSSTATAPRPHIRRSHSSHPDITSLCADWANSGPANKTLTFKPESITSNSSNSAPRRRKHSSSVSIADPNTGEQKVVV